MDIEVQREGKREKARNGTLDGPEPKQTHVAQQLEKPHWARQQDSQAPAPALVPGLPITLACHQMLLQQPPPPSDLYLLKGPPTLDSHI